MKGSNGTRKIITRESRGRNKDIFIFAFFLILSFFFWYLNSLDKEIEATIRYPLRYTNIPVGREITSAEPLKVNLYLKGTGSSVLRQKLSSRKYPLSVDIAKVNYRRVPESKNPQYFIASGALVRSFAVQLRSEFEIISIKPDTLFFTLGKAQSAPVQRKPFFNRRKK